jgi:serine/threonine protein kinase
MSPTDWETIKQIFSAVLNVPAAGRDEYLDTACAGRTDIRGAVDELLRAHYEASGTFLEPNTIVVRAAWLFQPNDSVAGRFRVVKPIARGAMGEVYRVYDERLRLHVALKAIRPELLGDVDTVERFRREVSVTRNIAHEGLCRVFDLVEHPLPQGSGFPDGTIVPCLTMQMLEGESLEDWLAVKRPMATDEAMPIVRQIAAALLVWHAAGVVHRDLKPSNVMLVPTEHGRRAVLTDFGLAKPLEEGIFETQGSAHGGAPFFMAPELFRDGRPSVASDIYALGLLIDEMVTTTRAFSASSLHGLLLDKLGDGPTPPSERAAALPRVWETTILRCLAAEPGHRFASAAAVMSSLSGEGEPFWKRPLVHRFTRPARPARRMRLTVYAAGVVVALTGAVTISTPAASPTSVVILPFNNLTGDAGNQYLAVGIVGELGRRLNRVPGWSVFTPRDPDAPVDPSQRATFSLAGHVQQEDATLRITVQLTDTARGTLLWSENFEGSRARGLDLQEKLAEDTQTALKREAARRAAGPLRSLASLVSVEWPFRSQPSLPPLGTSKPEAYDNYLRGRYIAEERTLDSALTAIALYRRAVELDPNFAAPYTGLADVQAVLMDQHYAPHGQLLNDADR